MVKNKIYDVIIIGGGPAGFSAAVNCGRLGLKTLIIEQNGYFGGANVAADSGTIGGLFNSTPNPKKPEQIVTGFAKEFSDLLEQNNGLYRHQRFFNTWLSPHQPAVWKLVADQLIKDAQVDVLFNTTFVNHEAKDKAIKQVSVCFKNQKQTYEAKVFIDASGDGALAFQANVPFWFGHQNKVQSLTTIFRLGNIKWTKESEKSIANIQSLVEKANQNGFNLPRTLPFVFRTSNPTEALINATSVEQTYQDGTITAFDNKRLSEAESELRAQVEAYKLFVQKYLPGFEKAFLLKVAEKVGIRQSRSFEGMQVLTNDDVIKARKFKHGLVRSAWPIEIHKGAKGVSIYSLDNDYYEIPYECFVPKNYDNLFFLGRAMSAEHEALASARVTAQCLEEGKAFAYAAYLQIKHNLTNKTINPLDIRALMAKTGSNI